MIACGQDGVGIKRDCKDTGRNFGDDGYVHFLDYAKTHKIIIHFKYMQFIECQVHLNKTEK